MHPLVSVVIPTYNRAQMLEQAIDSVLAQDYPNFELIVVDDGSSDHTSEILNKYSFQISCHYQERQGVSSARNHGTRLSRGKYICFLDSDDLWQHRKLSVQVEFMELATQIPLCYTDEIWIRNGVRVNPHNKHRKYSGRIFKRCLPLCIISPSSAMIHRDFLLQIGGFDESLPACEDYDLWLRITKDHPVEFIPKPLIIKRGGHDDQLSHKYWGNDRFRVKSLKKLLLAGDLNDEQTCLVEKYFREKCRILANGCFKRDKISEGEHYLELLQEMGLA